MSIRLLWKILVSHCRSEIFLLVLYVQHSTQEKSSWHSKLKKQTNNVSLLTTCYFNLFVLPLRYVSHFLMDYQQTSIKSFNLQPYVLLASFLSKLLDCTEFQRSILLQMLFQLALYLTQVHKQQNMPPLGTVYVAMETDGSTARVVWNYEATSSDA